MDNKELTHKAHLITLHENYIKFLKDNIECPFIEIKCYGAARATKKLSIRKELAEKMFLFLEQEYTKDIDKLKEAMRTILNNKK